MRLRLRLLPGEWVLTFFVLYAVVRLFQAHNFALNQSSLPRSDFLIVCLSLLGLRLYLEYRRTPWTEEAAPQRRLHVAFLVSFLAFLPFIVPPFPSLRPPGGWEGAATDVFLALYGWAQVVLLVLVPFGLFWLASGQHIKLHGRLDTVGMFRSRWRTAASELRDWLPLIALIYFYGLMGPVIGKGLFGDQDAILARIDRVMFFGRDPRILCEAIISRPLSEWLSACYVFYLPLYPIVLASVSARRDPAPFRELSFALTLTLAVGYVVYTIVPAQGPLFLDRFDVSLDAYLGWRLKAQLMDRTRVPRDCFPSLHTAASMVLLWGAHRNVRPLFWVLLPIVASIPFACVYLRYHYVIDIIAGLVLFGLVTTLTARSKPLQLAFHRASPV